MFKYFALVVSVCILSLLVVFFNFFIYSKMNSDELKKSPFECGFIPSMSVYSPFSMQFFLVALIFLIFDVELILLFPLLIELSGGISFEVGVIFVGFLLILSLGLFLEWSQSILEWCI